ncbi:hypothetical protein STENM327S_07283 [Streptomyces tendae]
MSQSTAGREATPRHYLMCRPTYFDVTYAINPWMDPGKPVDTDLAVGGGTRCAGSTWSTATPST